MHAVVHYGTLLHVYRESNSAPSFFLPRLASNCAYYAKTRSTKLRTDISTPHSNLTLVPWKCSRLTTINRPPGDCCNVHMETYGVVEAHLWTRLSYSHYPSISMVLDKTNIDSTDVMMPRSEEWRQEKRELLLVCYKNISRTSAVSSTNFG